MTRPNIFGLGLLLVLCIASACNGPAPATQRAPNRVPTTTLALPTARSSTVATGCSAPHSVRLEVVAERAEELPYVHRITACTDSSASETLLINRTDVVWTLHASPSGAPVRQLDAGSPEFDSFAEVSRRLSTEALLFPHTSAVVKAPPTAVSWRIQGGLTASWIVHRRIVEKAKDSTKDIAVDILSGSSAGRPAVLTCATAAYELAGTDLERLTGDDPFGQLVEGLKAASETSQCGGALAKARADHARRYGARPAAWTTGVSQMSDDLRFVAGSSSLLDEAARFIKAVVRFR